LAIHTRSGGNDRNASFISLTSGAGPLAFARGSGRVRS
jgi:hypothetical protein